MSDRGSYPNNNVVKKNLLLNTEKCAEPTIASLAHLVAFIRAHTVAMWLRYSNIITMAVGLAWLAATQHRQELVS